MLPQFFSQMPRPKAGTYVAEVITESPFRHPRTVWSGTYNGRLRAYCAARWKAFLLDLRLPTSGGWEEIGIKWRVHVK